MHQNADSAVNICVSQTTKCAAQLKFSAAELIAVHCSVLLRMHCMQSSVLINVMAHNVLRCILLHCDNRFQLCILCSMMHCRVLKCSAVFLILTPPPVGLVKRSLLFCSFAVFLFCYFPACHILLLCASLCIFFISSSCWL